MNLPFASNGSQLYVSPFLLNAEGICFRGVPFFVDHAKLSVVSPGRGPLRTQQEESPGERVGRRGGVYATP